MTKLLLLLAILLGGCTANRAMVALNVTDAALFACDATQTYTASHGGMWSGGLREGDPVQGSAPSGERIYGLMAANIIINAAITALPVPKWMRIGALGGIGIHVANTVNNNREYVSHCGL